MRALAPEAGETVVVSAAAGGVGSLAVQLARRTGATVIGLAGEPNHDWLREREIVPVTYGEGQGERILEAAGGRRRAPDRDRAHLSPRAGPRRDAELGERHTRGKIVLLP